MIDVEYINAAFPAPNPPHDQPPNFRNKKDMLTIYFFCSVSRTPKLILSCPAFQRNVRSSAMSQSGSGTYKYRIWGIYVLTTLHYFRNEMTLLTDYVFCVGLSCFQNPTSKRIMQVIMADLARGGWRSAMSQSGNGSYTCCLVSLVVYSITILSPFATKSHILAAMCPIRRCVALPWSQNPTSKRNIQMIVAGLARRRLEQYDVLVWKWDV